MIPYARKERRGKRRARGQSPLISSEEERGKCDEHEEDRKREKKWRRGEIGGSGFKSLLKR